MTDYKKLYFTLFNGISEVTVQLQKYSASLLEEHISEEKTAQLEQCISELKQVQLTAEEMYIAEGE